MMLETSVSKRLPIPGVPYSSQCFSICIREDQSAETLEEIKERSVLYHNFLEHLIDSRIKLTKQEQKVIPAEVRGKARPITDKQMSLILRLVSKNDQLDINDLYHVLDQSYRKGKLEELNTIEASMVITALQAKDLSLI